MDRRGFLKGIGLTSVGLALTPMINFANTPDDTPFDFNHTDSELTDEFFTYLERQNVDFNWVRLDMPIEPLGNDKYVEVSTKKLRTTVSPDQISDLRKYFRIEVIKQRMVFDSVIKEISGMCRKYDDRTIYLYQLLTQSYWIKPKNEPNLGFLLRSGFDRKRVKIDNGEEQTTTCRIS